MDSYHQALLILNILLLLKFTLATPPCNFPAIFNFGDSNSDTGGLSAAFGAAPPPNGETFFKKPAGRYCDGRLVIDFIASSLGIPFLDAYLDSIGTNFSHGANFATAGSTIRRENRTLFQSGFSPFSLDVQTWQFNQFINRSQFAYEKGGVYREMLPTQDIFSKALYTFDIGQNDLTSGYFTNLTTKEVKGYLPDLMERFTNLIKAIYDLGGRFFWIHNTGPIGCLPYVLVRVPALAAKKDQVGCGEVFNEAAQLFNAKLKETVAQLRKDLPSATFTYVDVYSVKYEMFKNPGKHGFEEPLISCCGHGGKYNYDVNAGCGATIRVNNTEILIGKSCPEPLKKVCWDGIHFTEAANRFIFEQIADGKFSDPPVPLKSACLHKV
jgi:phospholipase/lecithinase/hemolysin